MKDEKFSFDRSLRELFQNIPQRFVHLLVGQGIKEVLDVSFPKVEERRVDLLAKLDDGTLFHLEIQSTNDNSMPKRMLKYLSLIYDKYNTLPLQIVLYVGEDDIKIHNNIKGEYLNFSYQVKDIREFECQELIQSPNINDNILSLLCNIKNFDKILQRLKEKIYRLDNNQKEDYLRKVFYLLRLRPKLNKFFEENTNKELPMPFTIVLEKDPYYLKGIEKGIEKGKEQAKLETLLQTAALMIQEYNIPLQEVATKLNLDEKLIKQKLNKSKS